MADYPRDLIGYGATPPHAQWPNDARIAVQFVMNYEWPIVAYRPLSKL
jgi:hypothetical protein